MADYLFYQAKVAAVMGLLVLFYRLALRKKTLHGLNRTVLLFSAVGSFLLPFCVITFHRTRPLAEVTQLSDLVPTTSAAIPQMIGGVAAAPEAAGFSSWPLLLGIIYVAGALAALVRLLVSLVQTLRIIRHGEHFPQEDGTVVVVVSQETVPFSWMRYLVVSSADYAAGRKEVFDHERAHIAYHHAVDLLLVDALSVVQWFNPAVWLLRADLCAVHEYQADAAVLSRGADVKEYQWLLIEKSAALRGYALASGMAGSVLKSRVWMMSQPRSSASCVWRLLILIPFLCLTLLVGAEIRTDGYDQRFPPILLLDQESISLDELLAKEPADEGNTLFFAPDEAARMLGRKVSGGIVSFTSFPETLADGSVPFRLIPGFNVTEPDRFPLLLVNGVVFPYQRRREFQQDHWYWKWFAFIHAEDAIPLYGEAARNGAFILYVSQK